MRRTRTGKKIELTTRDIEIFRLLERYRYLRSTYVHAFVGGASQTRFKERLGDLYHEGGYLDRPKQQWQVAGSRYVPVVYENTEKSRRLLHEQGIVVDRREAPHRQFSHTLMTCEILASIELATHDCPGLRFIPISEILGKVPERTCNTRYPMRIPAGNDSITPDGLFGLEYESFGRKSYRFFCLEADRATMPIRRSERRRTSFLAKILTYRELLAKQAYKSHLGLPNLIILTVTTSESHKAHMLIALRDAINQSPQFLFKAMGDMASPMPTILTAPWERVGCSPLAIASP
jgi:hypothetical protein